MACNVTMLIWKLLFISILFLIFWRYLKPSSSDLEDFQSPESAMIVRAEHGDYARINCNPPKYFGFPTKFT